MKTALRDSPKGGFSHHAARLWPRAPLTLAVLLTVFLLTGLFFTGLALGEVDPAENGEDITFFRIGTGATSGTYFPIGGLIASAISNPPGSRACDRGGSCGVPGMIAVAQSTEGSVANIEAIAGGELESGLSQADVAHWALTGTKVFAKKKKAKGKNNKDKNKKPLGETLRAIANLFPENVHLVVRADEGIKSVFNLQKKRVSLGEPESGTLASVLLVLKGYGLTRKDMKPLYLPPGEAADGLREGTLDAFFLVAGSPVTAIADLARTIPIALVPIVGSQSKKIRKNDPFFVQTVISKGVYEGVDHTWTLGVGAQWLVSAEVPEGRVYAITKALWHDNVLTILKDGHPLGEMIRLKTALDGLTVPLHPGAARFYHERGMIDLAKPDQAQPAKAP